MGKCGVVFIGVITIIGACYNAGKTIIALPKLTEQQSRIEAHLASHGYNTNSTTIDYSSTIDLITCSKTLGYIAIVVNVIIVFTTLPIFCTASDDMKKNKAQRKCLIPYMVWQSLVIVYIIVICVIMFTGFKGLTLEIVAVVVNVINILVSALFLGIVAYYYYSLGNYQPTLPIHFSKGQNNTGYFQEAPIYTPKNF